MASVNMVFGNIRSMASKIMVLKKCYLLAGVVMAANMFIVNEVKAMDKIKQYYKQQQQSVIVKHSQLLLYYENTLNFVGTLALSAANNYFGWWDYNEGGYWKLGCWGRRSESFIKGIFQIEINLNLVRAIFWTFPGIGGTLDVIKSKSDPRAKLKNTAALIVNAIKVWGQDENNKEEEFKYSSMNWLFYYLIFLVQGFISIPLTVNISKFSISISLDSIIWEGIGKSLSKKNAQKKAIMKKKLNDKTSLPKYIKDYQAAPVKNLYA